MRTLGFSTVLTLLLQLPRFAFIIAGKLVKRLRLKDPVVSPSPSAHRPYRSGSRRFLLSNLWYSHLGFLLPLLKPATPVGCGKTCPVLCPHEFNIVCATAISFNKLFLLLVPHRPGVSISLGHSDIPGDVKRSTMGLRGERGSPISKRVSGNLPAQQTAYARRRGDIPLFGVGVLMIVRHVELLVAIVIFTFLLVRRFKHSLQNM